MNRRLVPISISLALSCGGAAAFAQSPPTGPAQTGQDQAPKVLSGNVEPRPEQAPGRLESARHGRVEAQPSCTDAAGKTWFRGQAGYPTCQQTAHHKNELSGRVASPADLSSTNSTSSSTGYDGSRPTVPVTNPKGTRNGS